MATLTPEQLAELRQRIEGIPGVEYTKPEINAVIQAIEDYFTDNTAPLYMAMEAAHPGLSDEQKGTLVKYSLLQKFGSM